MKKLISMFLALILMLSVCFSCASAESDWADYTCTEAQFSTRIPVSGTSGYDDSVKGLTIYTDVPGYIPYVIVKRRPMDMKFSDPENYLNNVYREHLEDSYGDNYLGMFDEAGTWEIGGKQLLGARYKFMVGEYTVVQLQLIEIREAGDVEYTVKYIEGQDEATMAALNEAVRYYQETDTAPAVDVTAVPAAESNAFVPVFMTPSEFVNMFNSMMNALADKYADQLGEEGVRIVTEDYTFTQQDPQGAMCYYGCKDWNIEAGFVFADEESASYTSPALTLNFNIRNSVPETIMDFAKYTIKTMIAYEYREQVSPDDLYAWFDSAEDLSDVFELPGYTLNVMKSEEYTQYLVLLPADQNPYIE